MMGCECIKVASNHGRAVGKTISGDPQPFDKIPVFWSSREVLHAGSLNYLLIQSVLYSEGQQLRYCGFGGHDDVVIKGDPGEMKVRTNNLFAPSIRVDPFLSVVYC